tara:strand:- start:320 stop:550 length:231 start_codon:yes stop_codon:yes gene_type:complete
MGLPLYDAMWVRNRMIKILRQDGFYVEGVNPTTLIIDWSTEKLEEQREIDYQNDRAKKKKRKEKRIKNSPPKLVKL